MPSIEQELPHHRLAEIAVGLFDQQHVAEIPDVAVKGEGVGVTVLAFDLCGQSKPKLRLTY